MNDAHNHLQDQHFAENIDQVIEQTRLAGLKRCVVNGTQPSDWLRVSQLAADHPDIIVPSFGLHPWCITAADKKSQPCDQPWFKQLQRHLDNSTHGPLGIGECGLDRAIIQANTPRPLRQEQIDRQLAVFIAQLQLATERNLPISIHCVQAWGLMLEVLRSEPLPRCGFLLHSYGGSAELIPELTQLGAYFSFSAKLLHPQQQKRQNIFRQVPAERLLIETDAPHMSPPDKLNKYPLFSSDGQKTINHPANLRSILQATENILDCTQLGSNFNKLFRPNSTATEAQPMALR